MDRFLVVVGARAICEMALLRGGITGREIAALTGSGRFSDADVLPKSSRSSPRGIAITESRRVYRRRNIRVALSSSTKVLR